jgi:hypothetical protein
VGEVVRPAAPPRPRGGQHELLAEQPAGDGRQELGEARGLDEPAADRVGQGHPAGPHRLHQTGRAAESGAVELQWIALAVGDPPQEDVHRHEAPERLEAHATVPHREVAPFHERVAEVAGEVGVFEVGAARGPRTLQGDPRRVASGGEAAQHRLQRHEEGGQPLDVALLEHARQEPRDDEAIFQGVAEPLGHAGAVSEGEPLAVPIADDHRAVEMEPAAARLRHPVAAAEEGRAGVDEFRRHDALAQHVLGSVEIRQQGVEHAGPLVDAHLQPAPIVGGDHQRDRVEHPRPLLTRCLVVDVVGHAVVTDEPAGLLPALDQFRRRPGAEQVDQPHPVRSRGAVGTAQLVVAAFGRPVAGKRIGRRGDGRFDEGCGHRDWRGAAGTTPSVSRREKTGRDTARRLTRRTPRRGPRPSSSRCRRVAAPGPGPAPGRVRGPRACR